MKGFVTATVYEDDKVVQQVHSKNKLMEGAVNTLLGDLFYSDYITYDNNVKCSYTFNNFSQNSKIPDVSGNGLYLSKGSTNAITLTDGVVGSSGHFTGTQYYTVVNSAWQSTQYDFTIEATIRMTSTTGLQTIYSYVPMSGTSNPSKAALEINSGTPRFWYWNASSYFYCTSALGTLSTSRWYHLSAVHSTTYGSFLFVNGVLAVYEPTYTHTLATGYNYFGYDVVGCYLYVNGTTPTFTNYFNGDIDNISLSTSTRNNRASVPGQKYFEPPRGPRVRNRCLNQGTAYKYYNLVLGGSGLGDTTRYDGSPIDDYSSMGILIKTGSEFIVNLYDTTNAFTKTVAVNSAGEVKLTVTIPEGYATGDFDSVYLTDQCSVTRTDLSFENVTFPIVAKANFSPVLHKNRKQTLVIEWTLSLAAS